MVSPSRNTATVVCPLVSEKSSADSCIYVSGPLIVRVHRIATASRVHPETLAIQRDLIVHGRFNVRDMEALLAKVLSAGYTLRSLMDNPDRKRLPPTVPTCSRVLHLRRHSHPPSPSGPHSSHAPRYTPGWTHAHRSRSTASSKSSDGCCQYTARYMSSRCCCSDGTGYGRNQGRCS